MPTPNTKLHKAPGHTRLDLHLGIALAAEIDRHHYLAHRHINLLSDRELEEAKNVLTALQEYIDQVPTRGDNVSLLDPSGTGERS